MILQPRSAILDERTCRMICPVAAGMAGVCLMGIGLLRVATALSRASTVADDLLSFDALMFLAATLTAYFSLRCGPSQRLHQLERVADLFFIFAMILLTAACFIITYTIEPGKPRRIGRITRMSAATQSPSMMMRLIKRRSGRSEGDNVRTFIYLGACAGAMLTLAAPSAAQPAVAVPTVGGSWINPSHTVAVRTGECGGKLCAWVAWATPNAKADARDAGVTQLIGTALLQDYTPKRDGSWSGTVYVPDMGRRFSSTISPVGADGLKVKGCLIGGFICRSQLWERIQHVPVD